MRGSQLLQRLNLGEILILDGAIGTELQRRGAPMDSVAWCAVATNSHSDLLRQIHLDYIEAGATIITTNTFSSARHVLDAAGLGQETERINRTAVRLAREAVEESGRTDILIAGSMSSMAGLNSPVARPVGESVAASYREQGSLLTDEGVDAIVAEMMIDLPNSSLVLDAARSTGLPVMVGWSASQDEERRITPYRSERQEGHKPHSFAELMERGASLGGDVAGIMHSHVEVTGPALEILSEHWNGPLMAYAETGRFEPPNWMFSNTTSPSDYAELASKWVDLGVQVIGGCCGTTPEHIAALRSSRA
jgi:methionine synthase I (cobalamin-dependent)